MLRKNGNSRKNMFLPVLPHISGRTKLPQPSATRLFASDSHTSPSSTHSADVPSAPSTTAPHVGRRETAQPASRSLPLPRAGSNFTFNVPKWNKQRARKPDTIASRLRSRRLQPAAASARPRAQPAKANARRQRAAAVSKKTANSA